MRFRNACTVTAILCSACALDPEASVGPIGQVEEPILRGTDDGGRDPSVVVFMGDAPGGGFFRCTASIITPRIVLTAAHCVNIPGVDHYHVEFFESWNRQTDEKTGVIDPTGRTAIVRYADPVFDEGNILAGHDVGLVYLDSPVPASLVPLPLYRSRVTKDIIGATDRFVGFGIRNESDDDVLIKRQFAATPITGIMPQQLDIAQRTTATCFGDSGGPHLVMVNGVETIAGVTSFGRSTDCSGTSFNQRVDVEVPQILQFIADHDPQPTANCGADGICGWNCPDIDPDCPCISDGRCDVACPKFDTDPDCPVNCDDDGTCQRTGCPLPDPDCGNSALGETCTINQNCASDVCVVDGSGHVCSQICDASGGCPAGFACKSSTKICNPDTGDSGGGGCSVGGAGAGSGLLGGLAGLGALLVLRRRRKSRQTQV